MKPTKTIEQVSSTPQVGHMSPHTEELSQELKKEMDQIFGTRGTDQAWQKEQVMKLLATAHAVGRAEEQQRIEKAIELWFSSHDKGSQHFMSEDFVDFIMERTR